MLKDIKLEHISHCNYTNISIFKLPVLFGCDNHLFLSVVSRGLSPKIHKP